MHSLTWLAMKAIGSRPICKKGIPEHEAWWRCSCQWTHSRDCHNLQELTLLQTKYGENMHLLPDWRWKPLVSCHQSQSKRTAVGRMVQAGRRRTGGGASPRPRTHSQTGCLWHLRSQVSAQTTAVRLVSSFRKEVLALLHTHRPAGYDIYALRYLHTQHKQGL